MIDQESFVELVHGALAHLYDHAYLQGHPLAESLAPETMPDARGRALRRLLLHGLQDLKPPPEAPLDSPGWRHYQYLYLRYVEAKPVAEIAGGLAVSERQTRRRHRDALTALARVVWDHWRAMNVVAGESSRAPNLPTPSAPDSPLDTELRWIGGGPVSSTDVAEMIEGALAIVGRLANQYAIEISFVGPAPAAPVLGDRGILRQALVGALVYAIQHAVDRRVMVSVASSLDQSTITVKSSQRTPRSAGVVSPQGELGDVRRLLRAWQGELTLRTEASDLIVELTFPSARPRGILIVDDNPDVCQLYRRYLGSSGYQVVEASSGDAALQLITELRPACIVLDVMMPIRDGWEILQVLRGQPDSRDIPVLVCSVLQQRELALSLGATDFLAKPISQQGLLAALTRCCRFES